MSRRTNVTSQQRRSTPQQGRRVVPKQFSKSKLKGKSKGPSFIGNKHLESSPINLISVRQHGRNLLEQKLKSATGRTKHLIWDPELVGPLNYIISPNLLDDSGVINRSTLNTNSNFKLQSSCDSIIYLVLPNINNLRIISEQIKEHSYLNRHKSFYIFITPQITYLCEKTLNETGILGSIELQSLPIVFFPIDSDLLTMSLNDTFNSCLNGDPRHLNDIALGLVKFQAVFGKFPILRGKGNWACAVIDIMQRLMIEKEEEFQFTNKPEFNQCIIIDRTADMISPLLSPRTYEGLLDYVFDIKHSLITVPKDILGKSSSKKTKKDSVNIVLNSSDNIFKQIRDVNFKFLGPLLSQMAVRIQKGYDARHDAKSTKELNMYLKKFKSLQADHTLVEQHIHLADYIALNNTKKMKWKRLVEHEFALLSGNQVPSGESAEDYLEEMIGKNENINKVLRFLILISICQEGISSKKKLEFFKREIVQTYGLQYVLTLSKLEKSQLLSSSDYMTKFFKSQNNYNYNNIAKFFNLIKDPQEMEKSKTIGIHDLNLIGNGYAPLMGRLVEMALNKGWDKINEALALLPGKTYHEIKLIKNDIKNINNNLRNRNRNNTSNTTTNNNSNTTNDNSSTSVDLPQHKTVFIFIIGGITYSEISAIRTLESRGHNPWRFIIGSTNICNGDKIIESFIQKDFVGRNKN